VGRLNGDGVFTAQIHSQPNCLSNRHRYMVSPMERRRANASKGRVLTKDVGRCWLFLELLYDYFYFVRSLAFTYTYIVLFIYIYTFFSFSPPSAYKARGRHSLSICFRCVRVYMGNPPSRASRLGCQMLCHYQGSPLCANLWQKKPT
jgi:hypothetical protein